MFIRESKLGFLFLGTYNRFVEMRYGYGLYNLGKF